MLTPLQDAEFSIHQMVEVASRALSPGVNDPYTAIACIDNLASEMCYLNRVEYIFAAKDAIKGAMSPYALLFAGFEPADEDPRGVLLTFMEQVVDLPGDVILTYNASDVSREDKNSYIYEKRAKEEIKIPKIPERKPHQKKKNQLNTTGRFLK